MRATDVIRNDHHAALGLIEQYRNADIEDREPLENALFDALGVHEKMEDEYFYESLAPLIGTDSIFEDLEQEQAELESEATDIRGLPEGERSNRMMELLDRVVAHAEKEERELLPRAEELLDDNQLEELGAKMEPHSAAVRAG